MTTPDHPPEPQHLLLLGEIKGIVEGLRDGQAAAAKRFDNLDDRIDGMDTRLRAVEVRSAAFGAVSGGVMGIGMALLVEGLKEWLKRGGPTLPGP
jgi:hypothetical protein